MHCTTSLLLGGFLLLSACDVKRDSVWSEYRVTGANQPPAAIADDTTMLAILRQMPANISEEDRQLWIKRSIEGYVGLGPSNGLGPGFGE